MIADKITVRQAFIIFMLATLSPSIRLFPSLCAKYAGSAGWIAPIISGLAPIFIILILNTICNGKNRSIRSMTGAFDAAFGKYVCKFLLAIYLVWTLLLFLLYVRYYAERLVSSLFTSTEPDFFILAMLAVVFLAARSKLSAFARFSELMILVFALVFTIFFISLLPVQKVHNIFPVSTLDSVPVLRASIPIVSIWGFITLIFFLGDHFNDIEKLKSHGLKSICILAPAAAFMVLVVVGALGPMPAQRMPLPFFKVSKLIDIMQSFDRFEAVLASVWVIADFILISVFVFIIATILKELFDLSDAKFLSGPIVLFGFVGSLFIASGRFELDSFSDNTITHAINIVLCFAVPAAALTIGKIRKRI